MKRKSRLAKIISDISVEEVMTPPTNTEPEKPVKTKTESEKPVGTKKRFPRRKSRLGKIISEVKVEEVMIPINPTSERPVDAEYICKFFKISRPFLHSQCKNGKIRFHKMGRKLYFFESEVMEDFKQL